MHTSVSHISCMLWQSHPWVKATGQVQSLIQFIWMLWRLILLFCYSGTSTCLYVPYRCSFYSCDLYFDNKNLFGKLKCHRSFQYSRRVALASAQVWWQQQHVWAEQLTEEELTIRNKPPSSTSVIWTLIL